MYQRDSLSFNCKIDTTVSSSGHSGLGFPGLSVGVKHIPTEYMEDTESKSARCFFHNVVGFSISLSRFENTKYKFCFCFLFECMKGC